MRSPPKCTLPELSSSTSIVTNDRPTVILSYIWMTAWPNASSGVTLASNGPATGLFLLVARAAGSHHIVTGSIKRWHGRTSASSIYHKVLCPLLGYWRMAIKLHTKHNGLTSEDRREYETVFDTFFESSCHYGLIIADGICKRQIQLTSRVIRKPHRLPKKPR